MGYEPNELPLLHPASLIILYGFEGGNVKARAQSMLLAVRGVTRFTVRVLRLYNIPMSAPASSISDMPIETVRARPTWGVSERAIVWVLVLTGLLAAAVRFNDQLIGLTGDNANFILLSRSLLLGKAYDNAETPWLYPALLMPFLAVAGPDNALAAIPWMKLLSMLFYALSLPLLYALVRECCGRGGRHCILTAVGVTALFGLNNIALSYANDVMTEMPYICAATAALLFWQKAVDARTNDRRRLHAHAHAHAHTRNEHMEQAGWLRSLWLWVWWPPGASSPVRASIIAAIPIVTAYYFRTIGLALMAGAVLTLLWHRRFRAAIASGLTMLVLALPWAYYANTMGRPNYVSKLFLRDPYNPALGYVSGVGEFFMRLLDSANIYLLGIFPNMLLPYPVSEGVRSALAPALLLLIATGLVLRMVRRVELPEVYTLLLLGIIFVWPFRGDRFFLPAYPLVLFYMLTGLMWAITTVTRIAARIMIGVWSRISFRAESGEHALTPAWPVRATAISLLLLACVPQLWWAAAEGEANALYLAGQAPPPHRTPDWQAYFEACRWLHDHTPPNSLIISRKFTMTTLYANRFSIPLPLRPPPQFIEYIDYHHVDYVLEDAFDWSTQTRDYLRPTLQAFPERFELVGTVGPPATRIWKVKH